MRAAAAALLVAALVAGCGTPSADLFVVDRSGKLPGAKLNLIVGDGGAVQCDGKEREITSDQLLQARELARDIAPLLDQGLTFPGGTQSQLRFKVTGQQGAVQFADTSAGREPVFGRVLAFTRAVATQACGLPR